MTGQESRTTRTTQKTNHFMTFLQLNLSTKHAWTQLNQSVYGIDKLKGTLTIDLELFSAFLLMKTSICLKLEMISKWSYSQRSRVNEPIHRCVSETVVSHLSWFFNPLKQSYAKLRPSSRVVSCDKFKKRVIIPSQTFNWRH